MRAPGMVLLIAAIAFFAGACAGADDKQEIRSFYAKLRLAIINAQPDALRSLTTPDFQCKGLDGKPSTIYQIVRQINVPDADVSDAKLNIMIYKFQISSPKAKVPFNYTYSATVIDRAGKLGPKDKKHKLFTTGTVQCDLVKSAGWQVKSMELQNGILGLDSKNSGGARAISP